MGKRKIDFSNTNWTDLTEATKKNALTYFKAAEELAAKEMYGLAYSLLVFSIEETAKKQVCWMYSRWLAEKRMPAPNCLFNRFAIGEELAKEMFLNHERKHRIVATQTIMDLMNTFDNNKRKSVLAALKEGNPHPVPEIVEALTLLRKIHLRRQIAMYVSHDGSGPQDVTKEEYSSLHKFAKRVLDSIDSFAAFRYKPFSWIEKQIVEMMGKI